MDNIQQKEQKALAEALLWPLLVVFILIAIHLSKPYLSLDLNRWGIVPRETSGLRGIIFAPLLHRDWTHLVSNIVPFWVLGVVVFLFFERVAWRFFLYLYLISGFFTWLIVPTGILIGLSYMVYGLIGFLLWSGIFRRSRRSIFISLVVILFYSDTVLALLPLPDILSRNVSWESHWVGLVVGTLLAFVFKNQWEADEAPPSVSGPIKTQFYFERTVFDKTKAERLEEALEAARLQEAQQRAQSAALFFKWFTNTTHNPFTDPE